MKNWYPNYQPRDRELVDYERFYVDGCEVPFRGPPLNPFKAERGSFFSCLGAAQTYGAFYEHPFPNLLADAIGLPALNLAVGGAGPAFYAGQPHLIEAMNRGRFVILQCMAARHAGNSRHQLDTWVEFVVDRNVGDSIPSWLGWKRMVVEEPEKLLAYVEETREAWIASSLDLIRQLTVPVIFFYFSRRPPDYAIDQKAIDEQAVEIRAGRDNGAFIPGLMGDFPQFVNGDCVKRVGQACSATVECLSDRGMGQPLISRFTGQPIGALEHSALGGEFVDLPHATHNIYYPSAEMHEDACAALLPTVRQILKV